jgi:hypothetical protein
MLDQRRREATTALLAAGETLGLAAGLVAVIAERAPGLGLRDTGAVGVGEARRTRADVARHERRGLGLVVDRVELDLEERFAAVDLAPGPFGRRLAGLEITVRRRCRLVARARAAGLAVPEDLGGGAGLAARAGAERERADRGLIDEVGGALAAPLEHVARDARHRGPVAPDERIGQVQRFALLELGRHRDRQARRAHVGRDAALILHLDELGLLRDAAIGILPGHRAGLEHLDAVAGRLHHRDAAGHRRLEGGAVVVRPVDGVRRRIAADPRRIALVLAQRAAGGVLGRPRQVGARGAGREGECEEGAEAVFEGLHAGEISGVAGDVGPEESSRRVKKSSRSLLQILSIVTAVLARAAV